MGDMARYHRTGHLPAMTCLALIICIAASGGDVQPVYDKDAFRAAQVELGRARIGGRATSIRWRAAVDAGEEPGLWFKDGETSWQVDLPALQKVKVDSIPDQEKQRSVGRSRRAAPARGRQRDREASPDGEWDAICIDWNVHLEAREGDRTIIITSDGSRKNRYGIASWVYGEELDQHDAMWWSPDSAFLAFYAFDERLVEDFYLLNGWNALRTGILREGYPKPGEPNPLASIHIYDRATGDMVLLPAQPGSSDDEPWYVYKIRFTPDGTRMLFSRTDRLQHVLEVMAWHMAAQELHLVVRETQDTWQENRPLMRFLDDGERFIWESEASGYRQYELRELNGRRHHVLTRGDFPVRSIVRIDEDAGHLYYMAGGDENPYHSHLYRVDLDGSGLVQLTPGGASWRVDLSPAGEWFVGMSESVTSPPESHLFRTGTTQPVMELAVADQEILADLGYPDPEVFTFRADDGETEIIGTLYKPAGFDDSNRYPLLIDVYGGPTSQGQSTRYRPGHAACSMGYLVASIGNRGTGGRGKAFQAAVYGQLGTVDLADQAEGARHLSLRPYVDEDRVGIHGHSYGGYMSAMAVLRHPDVFHAACAGAPVTDWHNYDTIYTERYMMTPELNPDGYRDGSCMTWAEQLQGRLLLLQGMVDDNVHPTNIFQLADALQDKGRMFEMMLYPASGHGLRGHSATVKWEFLARSLQSVPVSRPLP